MANEKEAGWEKWLSKRTEEEMSPWTHSLEWSKGILGKDIQHCLLTTLKLQSEQLRFQLKLRVSFVNNYTANGKHIYLIQSHLKWVCCNLYQYWHLPVTYLQRRSQNTHKISNRVFSWVMSSCVYIFTVQYTSFFFNHAFIAVCGYSLCVLVDKTACKSLLDSVKMTTCLYSRHSSRQVCRKSWGNATRPLTHHSTESKAELLTKECEMLH